MAIKQTAGRDSLGEFAPKFVKAEKKRISLQMQTDPINGKY